MRYLILIFFIWASCKPGNQNVQPEKELGVISFEVNGEDQAVEVFKEGMLLLHSFEYADAAERFQMAQELDPDMAMAYWGEALTKNHPLWRYQNKVDAMEILAKLGPNPEKRANKFISPLEKDLHQAIEILYGEGSKSDRDKLYSDYLGELREKYPENHEVASLYALSVLGAVKEGRDENAYALGAKIAQGILSENPNHPGALHYLIHSYDDPEHAHLAKDAADKYAVVAPDAGHALHMPSHIYIALGLWDEVIRSNIDSWEASVARKDKKNLDNNAYNYHALNWLMYGYLQLGQYEKAKNLVVNMIDYCTELDAKRARSYLIMMKGAYLIESDDWDKKIIKDTFSFDDLNVQAQAVKHYTLAMADIQSESNNIDTYIDAIEESVKNAANEVLMRSTSTCSGNFINNTTSQLDIDRARVIQMELKGYKEWNKNNLEEADKWFKEATELEFNTSFQYGPPDIVKPSSELYAEFLEETGNLKEARKYYKRTLERAPKRKISQDGYNRLVEA